MPPPEVKRGCHSDVDDLKGEFTLEELDELIKKYHPPRSMRPAELEITHLEKAVHYCDGSEIFCQAIPAADVASFKEISQAKP